MRFFCLAVLLCFVLPLKAGLVDLPPGVSDNLQAGDIIVRKGGGALSYQLMQISGENYSHCGIVVKQEKSWMVIEASDDEEGDGVRMIALSDFVKYTADSALFICRQVLDTTKGRAIAERAFYYLGQNIPFDYRFNLTDPAKFYCSELLLHVFLDVFNDPVFEVRRQHKTYVPLFATFFDTAKFEMIFNLERVR